MTDILKYKSKGIDYLVQNRRIENTPQSIAKLLSNEEFDKHALGTFLSEETSHDILKYYVDNLEFIDMDFDLALRFVSKNKEIEKKLTLIFHEGNI